MHLIGELLLVTAATDFICGGSQRWYVDLVTAIVGATLMVTDRLTGNGEE